MKDLHNNIKVSRFISPIKQTNADTAIVSQIIDTQGYESLEMLIAYGSISDTDVTFVTLVEDGDDSGLTDNAAVADAFLLGTEALATPLFSDDNTVWKIGYIGSKRYVRVTITPTNNNSGDILVAGIAIQGHARHAPVA